MGDVLTALGIEEESFGAAAGGFLKTTGDWLDSVSPVDGKRLGRVRQATPESYEEVVKRTLAVYERWRLYPAPKRGELVRQMGLLLRDKKRALGRLVTLE